MKLKERERWQHSHSHCLMELFGWIVNNHPEILTETEEVKDILIRLIAAHEKILEGLEKRVIHSKLRQLVD